VTGRNTQRGAEVVERIAAGGGKADFVRADLASGLSAARELADEATSRTGGHLDILVNNAALLINPGPTADVDEDLLDRALGLSEQERVLGSLSNCSWSVVGRRGGRWRLLEHNVGQLPGPDAGS
jgi:NAD(P)-dependent dehydrogenase (short-subunit alcohol dehydrogenase family)